MVKNHKDFVRLHEDNYINTVGVNAVVTKQTESVFYYLDLEQTPDTYSRTISLEEKEEIIKLRDLCNQILDAIEKAEKELEEYGSREDNITRE